MTQEDNAQFLDFLTIQLEKNNKVYIETKSVANGFYFYGYDNMKISCSTLPNTTSISFVVNSTDLFNLICVNIDYKECQSFIRKIKNIVINDKITSSHFSLVSNFENWLNYMDPIVNNLKIALSLLEGNLNNNQSPTIDSGVVTIKLSEVRETYQNKAVGLLDIVGLPTTIYHKPSIDNGNREFTNYILYIPHEQIHNYPILNNNLTVGKKIENLADMLSISGLMHNLMIGMSFDLKEKKGLIDYIMIPLYIAQTKEEKNMHIFMLPTWHLHKYPCLKDFVDINNNSTTNIQELMNLLEQHSPELSKQFHYHILNNIVDNQVSHNLSDPKKLKI